MTVDVNALLAEVQSLNEQSKDVVIQAGQIAETLQEIVDRLEPARKELAAALKGAGFADILKEAGIKVRKGGRPKKVRTEDPDDVEQEEEDLFDTSKSEAAE